MWKVFCVNYDLNRPGKDYEALYKELRSSADWCHPLESTWLVLTKETAQELFNRLKNHLDTNDHILITQFKGQYYGILNKIFWEWIDRYPTIIK